MKERKTNQQREREKPNWISDARCSMKSSWCCFSLSVLEIDEGMDCARLNATISSSFLAFTFQWSLLITTDKTTHSHFEWRRDNLGDHARHTEFYRWTSDHWWPQWSEKGRWQANDQRRRRFSSRLAWRKVPLHALVSDEWCLGILHTFSLLSSLVA